jgi:hypothetical protein
MQNLDIIFPHTPTKMILEREEQSERLVGCFVDQLFMSLPQHFATELSILGCGWIKIVMLNISTFHPRTVPGRCMIYNGRRNGRGNRGNNQMCLGSVTKSVWDCHQTVWVVTMDLSPNCPQICLGFSTNPFGFGCGWGGLSALQLENGQ